MKIYREDLAVSLRMIKSGRFLSIKVQVENPSTCDEEKLCTFITTQLTARRLMPKCGARIDFGFFIRETSNNLIEVEVFYYTERVAYIVLEVDLSEDWLIQKTKLLDKDVEIRLKWTDENCIEWQSFTANGERIAGGITGDDYQCLDEAVDEVVDMTKYSMLHNGPIGL